MPADLVEIVIGGRTHSAWSRYEVDSDLMTAADAWSVSLAREDVQVPTNVKEATAAEIRVGGQVVMTGYIDARAQGVRRGQQSLELRGRDAACLLLDCSAPIWSAQELTLDQVVAKIVRPLGITKIRIDADRTLTRDRVAVEPGESGWEALRRAAEANGLWPWFDPDGTLVVGGPDYSTAPVDTLVMRRDGVGNNIVEAMEQSCLAERFSEVTVLGQAHGTDARVGRNAIRGTAKDSGIGIYRPRILVDHEAVNETIATARARKVLSDARVRGYELSVTLMGHRTAGGVLWQPGQRVRCVVEDLGVDGIFFVMARRFSGPPAFTTLSLREDGAWVLEAHPKTLRRRKGKAAAGSGLILDLGGSINDIPGILSTNSTGGTR